MLGQALLTQRMGKRRVIAETGAGQHGVATATAAALLGLECVVYMGEEDTVRQALNVARMRLLGAEVVPVTSGSRTLKDAINEAMRDWVTNVDDTHYLLGTVAGPHPFPVMVRDFHRVIGDEARAQVLERVGRLPDAVAACVGGGSNAIGIFHALPRRRRASPCTGTRPAGDGVETGRHAATISAGSPGVLHGTRSYLLQDDDGQTIESHSISAGLDYPGVGPEHAWLADSGRAEYHPVTDAEAMEAFGAAVPHRGHHPGDRERARARRRPAPGPRAGPGGRDPGQPVRARRQGRRDRGPLVRHRPRRHPRGAAVSASPGCSPVPAPRAARPLIGYLPAGFPDQATGIAAVQAMVEAGVDVVEVGLPYSDPVMDGPVIQRAAEQALARRHDDGRRASRRSGRSRRPAPRRS